MIRNHIQSHIKSHIKDIPLSDVDFTDFSFYIDLTENFNERISLQTLPAANYDGPHTNIINGELVEYTADEYVRDAAGNIVTFGGFSQFVPKSEDTSAWDGSGPWTQTISLDADTYRLAVWKTGATVTVTSGTATIDAGASATPGVDDTFVVSVGGTITLSSDVENPRAQIANTETWRPYAHNDTTGSLVVSATKYDYNGGDERGPRLQIVPDVLGSVYTGPVVGDELYNDTIAVVDGNCSRNGSIYTYTANSGTGFVTCPVNVSDNDYVIFTYTVDTSTINGAFYFSSGGYTGTSVVLNKTIGQQIYKVSVAVGSTKAVKVGIVSSSTTGVLIIKDFSVKKVSRNIGLPLALGSLDGVADGVELVTTNVEFTIWTADNPDDYVVQYEDADGYITEHVNGARIYSLSTGNVQISRQFSVIPGTRYKFLLNKSDHVSGDVRLYVRDLINLVNILPPTEMRWTSNDEYSYKFEAPALCTNLFIAVIRASNVTTDYVMNSWSLQKLLPAVGQIEYTGTPLFNPSDTSADGDIITVNETDSLLVHTSDGEFEVSDGTNVSTVDPDYVKDTEYTVTIPYNTDEIQISTGGESSAVGTFAETFSPGDFIGIGGSDAPMSHKLLKIKKTGDPS